MSTSVKFTQVGAFKNEVGKTTSNAWGTGVQTLGASDAFPYLSIGKKQTINKVIDESINSLAYPDVPVQTGIQVESEFSRLMSFRNMGRFWYWNWGYEHSRQVCVFICTTDITSAVAGAVYHDADMQSFTFIRYEGLSSTSYIGVFQCTAVPLLASGNLTKDSGTGPSPIAFTAHSTLKGEHILELDANSRHFIDYTSDERTQTGADAGWRKNRRATIGIKMGPNDYRYRNAMCRGFTIKSAAGQLVTIDNKFCAYSEGRGDYSSAAWTYPTNAVDSDQMAVHHQATVELGTAVGSLTALGITDINVGVDIPLQFIQDTLSGLYLSEPVLEAKYGFDIGLTLSRHSVDTFEGYRDAWDTLYGRIIWDNPGNYERIVLLMEEMKMAEAGPSDDEVAKDVLKLTLGYDSTPAWDDYLYQTSVQNSPLRMLVRDNNTSSYMLAI